MLVSNLGDLQGEHRLEIVLARLLLEAVVQEAARRRDVAREVFGELGGGTVSTSPKKLGSDFDTKPT
jgi:hypothetical protein